MGTILLYGSYVVLMSVIIYCLCKISSIISEEEEEHRE